MFTRHLTMKFKPNSAAQLTRTIEHEIIPRLRQQPGFRDEITFISPDRGEAIGNSFWDTREDAEAYHRTTYPEVLEALAGMVEGSPRVDTYEVTHATFTKRALWWSPPMRRGDEPA